MNVNLSLAQLHAPSYLQDQANNDQSPRTGPYFLLHPHLYRWPDEMRERRVQKRWQLPVSVSISMLENEVKGLA